MTPFAVIPAKAGTPATLRIVGCSAPFRPEVPAFAGMTGVLIEEVVAAVLMDPRSRPE